jgi:hypothetical protein
MRNSGVLFVPAGTSADGIIGGAGGTTGGDWPRTVMLTVLVSARSGL